MGLTAAYELLKRGYAVDLYEKENRLGGMTASFDFAGLNIERYYHFLCRTDYPLFELLKELRIEDRLKWVNTKMGFFHRGRLHNWGTPQALLAFGGIGPAAKLRYALHVLYTKNISSWADLDKTEAGAWLRKWLGEEAFGVLWKPLLDLKFFEYSDNLSAAWIGTRIKRIALSRDNVMQESLGYLDGGSDVLITALASAIRGMGGNICTGCGVDEVLFNADRSVKAVAAGGRTREYDAVISTIPVPYLSSLAPQADPDYLAMIRRINNITVSCAILKLTRPITGNFWLNINDPEIALPGIIEYSRLNASLRCTVVYAPFYMPPTHPLCAADDEKLIGIVAGALAKINPDFRPGWIQAAAVSRYQYAQPVCPPGFSAMLPPMRTPSRGFYAADTCFYYPEDRSITESVRIGGKIAGLVAYDAV